ncbi:MAG TPA: cyclopropane-fatty-acyl-phospholipid synthase family protein [Steroidobacteraceae bacterium]|jgi:cyclopropane-fatty-acyl-phospholipid synthase|nr:cyclopropane-fatty-acyl-phospholipid synthase family protein [Steroidobacteraceae bacterium]
MNDMANTAEFDRPKLGAFDRFLRRQLLRQLRSLRHGRLLLVDEGGQLEFGQAAASCPDLQIRMEILHPAFYRAVAANGSVGAGEAYADGLWRCDDLVGLAQLMVRNRDVLDGTESGIARLGGMAMRAWHALRRNTRGGSRRNIAAHYDLGNDFFALFLSSDLMYSSAIRMDESDTLETASTRKIERICRKLDLKPADRVIEIGTGWGGFALYAARHYGCHVTTTTISREQHALCSERVLAEGLGAHVDLLLEDYRDLRGQYDKLVSIEMVEAIGAPNLDSYFSQIGALLRPDGLALVQAITIEDHRYAQALQSVDYIKRHLFPGSFIPSINALLASKTRASDLALTHLEDFGHSYALTLKAWREYFMAHLPKARARGFGEHLIRQWEFYLAYCEGGFRERATGVAQLLLAKPGNRRAPLLPEIEGAERISP